VPKKRTSKVVPPSTVIPEKPVQTTPPPINVNKKDSDSSKTWMEWWNGLGKKNNENSNNGEDAPKKTTPPAKRGKGSSKIEKLEPKNTPDISKTPAPQKVALPETITFNNPAPTVPVNPLKKTSSSPVEEEEGGYKDFRVRALKSADGKDLYEVSIAYCPEGASVCGPIQKAQGSTIEEAKKKAKKAAKDAYDAYDEMQKSKPQPKKTLLNFPLDQ